MTTYTNTPGSFARVRRRTLMMSTPIVVIALLVGTGLPFGTREIDWVVIIFTLLMGCVAGGVGMRMGLKRQQKVFESYRLTISDDNIQREQFNTPLISIGRSDIKEITIANSGAIAIKGKQSGDVIIVSQYIENRDGLLQQLRGIHPISERPARDYSKLALPLVILELALMLVVFVSNNKALVAVCGSILVGGLTWAAYLVQTNKNVEKRTKRIGLGIGVVIAVVLWIMWLKVAGD